MIRQLVLCLACAVSVASAQQLSWSQFVSDTNSPQAFLNFGQAHLSSRKDSLRALAESAFVRAARLDPLSGRPSYLLALSTLLPAVRKSRGFFSSRNIWRHLNARQRARVDSLLGETFLREPFADFILDPILAPEELPPPDLVREREDRAYVAYQAGQYRFALDLWAQVVARSPERIDLRWHRAHVFYWQRQYDSAIVTLKAMLAHLAPADDSLAYWLPETDMLEYAMGIAYERAGNVDSAAEAYRRTLIANLGTYMARVRLSAILLDRGDTVNAVREVFIALDVAPSEPLILAHYGAVLVRVGRPDDALNPLQSVVRTDPAYATPYLVLGMAYIDLHRDPEALQAFEMFLDHAAKNDERRAWATYRVRELRASVKDSF